MVDVAPLLGTAANVVDDGGSERDDVDDVQGRAGVLELVIDGVHAPMERVQRCHRAPNSGSIAAITKPGPVGLAGAARSCLYRAPAAAWLTLDTIHGRVVATDLLDHSPSRPRRELRARHRDILVLLDERLDSTACIRAQPEALTPEDPHRPTERRHFSASHAPTLDSKDLSNLARGSVFIVSAPRWIAPRASLSEKFIPWSDAPYQ